MGRATFAKTKRFLVAAVAAAFAGCTGSGIPESDAPDSATLTVPGEPVASPQPVQAESVTHTPSRTTGGGSTTSEPVLKQPPPPRDTRPSIPWPPDTLPMRRDTN